MSATCFLSSQWKEENGEFLVLRYSPCHPWCGCQHQYDRSSCWCPYDDGNPSDQHELLWRPHDLDARHRYKQPYGDPCVSCVAISLCANGWWHPWNLYPWWRQYNRSFHLERILGWLELVFPNVPWPSWPYLQWIHISMMWAFFWPCLIKRIYIKYAIVSKFLKNSSFLIVRLYIVWFIYVITAQGLHEG